MSDHGFLTVGKGAQLPDNDVLPHYFPDRKLRLNVARVNGQLYAFEGLCTHEHCPLSSGLLEGTTIMCQCHGSQYDIRTGAVLRGPATQGLSVYEVREHEGDLQVKV